jgi:predicted DNA-binding protein (UPF0251 family)
LDQDAASERMNVSRQTFGRILAGARKVLAEAVVQGKALRINGGNYEVCVGKAKKCGRTPEGPEEAEI